MQLESLASLTITIHWPPHHTRSTSFKISIKTVFFASMRVFPQAVTNALRWGGGWKPWIRGGSTKVLACRHKLGRHNTSYGTVLSQCIMGYKLQSRRKSHSVLQHTGSYIIQQKILTKSAFEIGMWLPVNSNNNNKKLKW